ncbi:STAS domain-containing protein [Streptomyces minutiscleroticus]|uniref:STAS domain-containing protein n=1 Tax=Streptomyces minutiscleroticus TaxID=68238 RepID=A0A918U2T0_9ACTN|nr:STAS domain-containing protein [Streptomyces minutiscleroticus]GGX85399.1 hypothetical protein GCM10010358_44420 [Streptomyces minutiscleroticus]
MSWGEAAVPEQVCAARPAGPVDLAADLPYPLTADCRPDGDRTAVVLRGEIDRQAQEAVGRSLHDALRRSRRGVDLDLGGISFIDCSGLNVLLDLRRRALRDGKTVVVRTAGPAVVRLLSLAGALTLFGQDAGT